MHGVCNGSCIAPVLSDLVLAHFDHLIYTWLTDKNVLKAFRFVNDFLVVLNCKAQAIECESRKVLVTFKDVMSSLDLMHELLVNGQIRLLDIRFWFKCWCLLVL